MPALAALSLTTCLLLPELFLSRGASREIGLVRDVLALTAPGDEIFDCKGETVFRRRCVYDVFEGLTTAHIREGSMRDDVQERCVAKRICVASLRGRLPPSAEAFISQTYLRVGAAVRVAGSFAHPVNGNPGLLRFHLTIPAEYELVSADGPVAGQLDDARYHGRRFLQSGNHLFRPDISGSRVAVIWAPAADRHFTPFAPQ